METMSTLVAGSIIFTGLAWIIFKVVDLLNPTGKDDGKY